jgi:uncharacterized protein YwbE
LEHSIDLAERWTGAACARGFAKPMLTRKPKHNSGIRVFMTFSGEKCKYPA